MKSLFYKYSTTIFLVIIAAFALKAQGVIDPLSLPVYKAPSTITVDGILNEAVWNYNLPRLLFRLNGTPSGNVSTPTGFVLVKAPYTDTSSCEVRFIRDGMKLYISLKSDDKQVCRFGDSWEGDGLFLVVAGPTGATTEFKLYYNSAGVDPEIHYEGPSHSMGAGQKGFGTTVGDSSDVDGGYTAELMISLDSLGYNESNIDLVQLRMNIFDPDNYSVGTLPWGANGNFAKQFWGSEWGSTMRTLAMQNTFANQTLSDPQLLPVFQSNQAVSLDGNLSETGWNVDVPRLKFRLNGTPSGNIYTPTGFATVKPPYTDTSTCEVRFLHDGLKLYISLKSDDKQVCRFGDSWEGDGIFLTIAKADGSTQEFKLYYNLGGIDPAIHYEGPSHSAGAGLKGFGTTVNDSSDVDGGYTAELMIHLDSLGYTAANSDSIKLRFTIFDPDNYSDGVAPWGPNGNFVKQWWGSEWGSDMRTLVLSKTLVSQLPADPLSLPVYQTNVPVSVDGSLSEAGWTANVPRLKFQLNGVPSGNVFTPTAYAIVKPPYVDNSSCEVRFLHDGLKLYISLKSDDKQVCRFGDSWEGDGIFLTIAKADGSNQEFKLYYNLGGIDPAIHYEGPSHSTGAGVKGIGTTVNDSSNVDAGYTAELMIHLDSLGYTAANSDSIRVRFTIFDPDNYSDGVAPWGPNGNFAKQWWGSEWGSDMRTLVLSGTSVLPTSDSCKIVNVNNGWNMVAIPVIPQNTAVTSIFPLATSPLYGFNNAYVSHTDVATGKGYWIRYPSAANLSVCGASPVGGVELSAGWNMIGIFGTSVPVSGITTTPAGIISSSFYGYGTGYVVAASLEIGQGYWIRASQAGTMNLPLGASKSGNGLIAEVDKTWGKIIVTDKLGSQSVLYATDKAFANAEGYALPPVPPAGIFDARFSSQSFVENFGTSAKVISLSSAIYPVEIRAEGIDLLVKDRISGKLINTTVKAGTSIVIANENITSIEVNGTVKPIAFELQQNYPNPFNPSTTIEFSLPVKANVDLAVYNVIGQKVVTLAQSAFGAGSHKVQFNAGSFSSGVYFMKINARGDDGKSFSATKKMILMK